MTFKMNTATANRTKSIVEGIGSLINFGVALPIRAHTHPYRTQSKTQSQTARRTRVRPPVLIGDLISIDKATIDGRTVLFEGNAKENSVAVSQRKVEPGEHIMIRGKLTESGRLTEIVLVSESRGVSALLSGQSISVARQSGSKVSTFAKN